MYDESQDVKSDKSTKKAFQCHNIDLKRLWDDNGDDEDKDLIEYDQNDFETLSSVEIKQCVETIAEENEPESIVGTIVDDSYINKSEAAQNELSVDKMILDCNQRKQDNIENATKSGFDKNSNKMAQLRTEMNSTMKNFAKKGNVKSMRSTAIFGKDHISDEAQLQHEIDEVNDENRFSNIFQLSNINSTLLNLQKEFKVSLDEPQALIASLQPQSNKYQK